MQMHLISGGSLNREGVHFTLIPHFCPCSLLLLCRETENRHNTYSAQSRYGQINGRGLYERFYGNYPDRCALVFTYTNMTTALLLLPYMLQLRWERQKSLVLDITRKRTISTSFLQKGCQVKKVSCCIRHVSYESPTGHFLQTN